MRGTVAKRIRKEAAKKADYRAGAMLGAAILTPKLYYELRNPYITSETFRYLDTHIVSVIKRLKRRYKKYKTTNVWETLRGIM